MEEWCTTGPPSPAVTNSWHREDRIDFEEMRRNLSLSQPQRLADAGTRVLPRIDGYLDKGWTVSVTRFPFFTCADVRPCRWSRPQRTGRLLAVESTLAAYPKFKPSDTPSNRSRACFRPGQTSCRGPGEGPSSITLPKVSETLPFVVPAITWRVCAKILAALAQYKVPRPTCPSGWHNFRPSVRCP